MQDQIYNFTLIDGSKLISSFLKNTSLIFFSLSFSTAVYDFNLGRECGSTILGSIIMKF